MPNINTISFGPGQSNADLQAQQLQLQRQQKLAEVLRQQSLTPQGTQVVSGVAVKNSPLLGVAQLAKAFMANKLDKDTDAKQTEIGNTVAQRSAAALRALAPAGVFPDEQGAPGAGAPPMPGPASMPAPAAPPQELGGQPQMSVPGQQDPQAGAAQAPAPAAAPALDPETKARWVRALATYQTNPELGGKLIQELSKPAEFSTTPQYDQQGQGFVLDNRGNRKVLDGVKARDKLENVNGVWQNPYQQQNGAVGPQDPNQPFLVGPDGKVAANPAYQEYQMRKARAGATNITTKTEVKAAESIANQVGPMLRESATAADGAVAQIDAADRVLSALNSNKVLAGPLASKRLAMAQYGQMLGIGGKDDAERIANTRQVVRGMAEMTLQGRKQMSGQGAITESESKLAEKATSGDIDSLTPAELKIIAEASRRASQHTLASHQRKVNKAKSNPATAGIADYFDTTPYEGNSVDDLLKRYGGQ